jgi:hypothetical protein
MRREIERLNCQGENGDEYTVVIWQRFSTFRPLSGPAVEVAGVKDATLSDGRHVNFVGSKHDAFQILDTDQIIRRV